MTTRTKIYEVCRHTEDRRVYRFIATCKDDLSDGYQVVVKEFNFEIVGGQPRLPDESMLKEEFPTLKEAEAKADTFLRGHLDDGWKRCENAHNGALS
jgi:hypothetical protein